MQAARALETLKDSIIERDLLDSRIAQCKAAQNLLRADLAESALMSNLLLLESYHSSFPATLACRITKDFYKFRLADIRSVQHEATRLQGLSDMILGLDFWSEDSKTYKLMDNKQPAFAPLLTMLKLEEELEQAKKFSLAPTDLFGVIDTAADEPEQPKKKSKQAPTKTGKQNSLQAGS